MRLSPRSSSAGAAPRAPLISDQTSPPMTTATAGTSSSIQPPVFRKTSSHHLTFKVESRRPHRPARTTSRCRQTPVQGLHAGRPSSTSSLPAPEWSTDEMRESLRGPYSLTPPPPSPRRRRRKHNPNPRTTWSTTPDREEHSGLHHLAKPKGLSEVKKTAGPVGGDRRPCFRCSQTEERP